MNANRARDDRSLAEAVIGDGRPLLLLTGVSLALVGLFAILQAITGHFLPHDEAFLGIDAATLCAMHDCRIVHFMIHDRVAFGGSLVAVGALYLWLADFPLRAREGWAWWAFALSGLVGFVSFLTFIGYSYLDTWHGVATLALLPCFLLGLARSYQAVRPAPLLATLRATRVVRWQRSADQLGRALLLAAVAGLLSAGAVIMVGGMTRVFVPQDLHFLQLEVSDLAAISPRLVPLIAHDRAGFGGGLASVGIVMGLAVWCGAPSRSLWQVLALAGTVGFGSAIGVHFVVGYLNLIHLFPAWLGAAVFFLGLALSYRSMHRAARPSTAARSVTAR